MMEAVSTSETSVNIYQKTWRNNPEVSQLYTRRRENLKSQYVNQGDMFAINPIAFILSPYLIFRI
jgi:hypothetical protein